MDAATEIPVVVTARTVASEGVVILDLAPTDGSILPDWEPGAHIDILAPDDEVRQYSLCGSTDDCSVYRVAVLEEAAGRGFSKRLHAEADEGTEWRVRPPRSHFGLVERDRYLFIAGGIGITPMLPMIAQAERDGAAWQLLYGGRSRASMAFLDHLAQYGDRVHVLPQDEVGLLPLAEWLDGVAEGTAVYCCGPEPLINAVEDLCADKPKGTLHTERFSPRELDEPVLAESFEVELRASGITFQVPPDKSILQMVSESGVPTLSACQEGTCGTCETPVLEGIPEHRDSVLDEDERAANDYMMICCSRSCSKRLVLDL